MMVIVVQTTRIVPMIWGTMILRKTWISFAPSILAASRVSSGTPRRAALKITIANPVWIQMRMIIRKKLFQKGIVIQASGSPPKNITNAFRLPICSESAPRKS